MFVVLWREGTLNVKFKLIDFELVLGNRGYSKWEIIQTNSIFKAKWDI
jgi:hypothetical protein